MKVKASLFLFIIQIATIFGQYKIYHTPPSEVYEGEPIKIEAILEPPDIQISSATLYYRIAGSDSYNETNLVYENGVFKGTIPGGFVTPQGVEYLIIIESSDGAILAYPEVDPYNVPIFLSVLEKNEMIESRQVEATESSSSDEGVESGALILSPEEGSVIAPGELLIAVSLFNVSDVDLNSIRIFIDGLNITKAAEKTEDMILCRPTGVRPGIHSVRIEMKNINGESFKPLIWGFTMARSKEEAEKLIKYSGRIESNVLSEQIRGIKQDIQSIRVIGDVNYDWLKFRSLVFLTSQESPNRQPKNRYLAVINTPFVDLNFGDVTPRMNELGLNGKRIRGFEGNLKLKYINLQLIIGESERAIKGDIKLDSINSIYKRTGYTFKRNVFAIRPYFGSGRRFQLGLSVIKAKDDTLSVKKFLGSTTLAFDKIEMAGDMPEDNIVVGTDLTLTFDNRRVVFRTEGAFSMLNTNIYDGVLTKAKLDTFLADDSLMDGKIGDYFELSTIPIEPEDIKDIFIINQNQRPLLPIIPDTSGNIGLKQILDMPSTAFKSKLKLNYLNNYIIFEYRRIGPHFYSLANPYMRNNIQGYTISDKIRLFNGRLFLNLLFDQRRDNLSQENRATNTISLFSAGFSIYPGEGLPQINFSTRQNSRANDITTFDTVSTGRGDTLYDYREDNVTITQSFSISHKLQLGGLTNQIRFIYNNSDRVDRIEDRLPGYRFSSLNSDMYRISLNTQYAFPMRTYISFSKNTSKSGLSKKPNEFSSIDLRAIYDVSNMGSNVYAGYKYINATGGISFNQSTIYIGGDIIIFSNHRIRGMLKYDNLNDPENTYNDLSFNIGYTFTF
ncbi:MAG: hypothetical protein H0Z29_01330 [Candidatus Marinimicrobia bacterium]|nr:hypothetical protein [Candidatus Neomarinimicrobiota bacterium]